MTDTDSLIPLLLDIGDVSILIAVGQRTLWRWISTGTFPPPDVSVGAKFRRWKRATVEQWIAAQAGGVQMNTPPAPDTAEIIRALKLLIAPGQVTEFRALEATTAGYARPRTIFGYFDDPAKLAAAVKGIATAKGIYVIPNSVNPALLARAANRLKDAGKSETTSDRDITRRHWLLVDCDPVRPAGISADDWEHDAAIDRACSIRSELRRIGWPEPIIADSGNGGHLLYRVGLPADDGGIVKRCLEAVAAQHGDKVISVDTTVHNPARIWKLYGTWACKGDSTAERPHRMARIIDAPANWRWYRDIIE